MIAKCYNCGGEVRMVAEAGRLRAHRRDQQVLIPADLAIPTCQQCGEEYLDGPTTEAIGAAARAQGLDAPAVAAAGE